MAAGAGEEDPEAREEQACVLAVPAAAVEGEEGPRPVLLVLP